MSDLVDTKVKGVPKSLDEKFFVTKVQVCPECGNTLPVIPEVKCSECNKKIILKQEIKDNKYE